MMEGENNNELIDKPKMLDPNEKVLEKEEDQKLDDPNLLDIKDEELIVEKEEDFKKINENTNILLIENIDCKKINKKEENKNEINEINENNENNEIFERMKKLEKLESLSMNKANIKSIDFLSDFKSKEKLVILELRENKIENLNNIEKATLKNLKTD